jgi:thymidine phosphorylase
MALGAGRDRVDAAIDPAVGITLAVARGDVVAPGDPLMDLHYNDPRHLLEAIRLAGDAVTIADEPSAPVRLVIDEVK